MKNLKIIFTLILCFTLMSKTFSQTSADLDKKKGFKDFTLGDSYSKWSSALKYTNTADASIKYYDYTGTCCQQVFDYNLSKIRLGFKNDTLQVIYLTTEKQSDAAWLSAQYKSLKSSFTALFGKPVETVASDNSGNVTSGWTGKKVIMTLEYVYLGVKQDGDNWYSSSQCNILIGFTTDLKSGF